MLTLWCWHVCAHSLMLTALPFLCWPLCRQPSSCPEVWFWRGYQSWHATCPNDRSLDSCQKWFLWACKEDVCAPYPDWDWECPCPCWNCPWWPPAEKTGRGFLLNCPSGPLTTQPVVTEGHQLNSCLCVVLLLMQCCLKFAVNFVIDNKNWAGKNTSLL